MKYPSSSISLYIHIPFCSSKCNYCDFYSETCGFDRIPRVISQIINQLDTRYREFGSPEIKTLFIGGGTPSILPIPQLERLLKAINKVAVNPLEFTIESNPESITEDFLNLCMEYGVSRLSVGIQSSSDIILKTLGRKSSAEIITKALDLVKNVWRGELSLDFITSVPGQNKNVVLEDIELALKYNPDHISFYALCVEEGTPLEDSISKGVIEELSETETEDIWLYGRKLLKDHGFKAYEVSNYERTKPCLHNINYWELKPYLGIGPAAVSTILTEDNRILRITNTKSIDTFIKGQESNWGEEREVLDPKSFLEDYIIMGLRLKRGIDRSRFKSIFSRDIREFVTNSDFLIDEGLLIVDSESFKLTEYGFDTMNSVLVTILDSLSDFIPESLNWHY